MEKDMTLLDQAASAEESALDLAWKYYRGETEDKKPDFQKAVTYFEQARKADVTKEDEIVLPLARAYREIGKSIQAIHWYKHAMSEYGVTECEQELMVLYQTGVAGKELKEQADRYMAEVEQARKEKAAAEEAANLTKNLGPEPVEYPQDFLDDLQYLFAFEKEYVTLLNSTKPKKVPEIKRGLFGGNKKEVERIQKQNEEYEQIRKDQAELYEQQKKMVLKKKEELGIEDKLFFEYPLLTDNARTVVRNFRRDLPTLGEADNYSLYAFGDEEAEEFYLFDEGYSGRGYHSAATQEMGELLFFMVDDHGKIINKQNPGGENVTLFTYSNFEARQCNLKYLKKFFNNPQFMILYCDLEHLREHSDEKYNLQYIWDYDMRVISDYSHILSPEESLNNYYAAAKDLTEFYADVKGNYHGSMREYYTDNGLKNLSGTDPSGFSYDERYMKKAVVVYSGEQIVAILLPREKADVIVIHGHECYINLDVNESSRTCFKRVDSITLEKGTAWDYYAATTIHYAAISLAKQLKPVTGLEVKPEGLPDTLWRFWLRARYANQNKK